MTPLVSTSMRISEGFFSSSFSFYLSSSPIFYLISLTTGELPLFPTGKFKEGIKMLFFPTNPPIPCCDNSEKSLITGDSVMISGLGLVMSEFPLLIMFWA